MTRAGQKLAAGDVLDEDERQTTNPPISTETLRACIAYTRENIHPVITDEAAGYIRDYYTEFRAPTGDEDSPVSTTPRSVLTFHRLAEAPARIRLSERVELEDAERVVEIWKSCMEHIGVDPEMGQFDADVIEIGQSKSQRDRIKTMKGLIQSYTEDPEYQYGAPLDEVLQDAEAAGISVVDILLRLKAGGIPSGGSFRFAVQLADYRSFRVRVVPQHRTGGLLALTRTEFSFVHQKSSISEDGAKPPVPLSLTV